MACRRLDLLMTMDHHLVRADFIGIVQVSQRQLGLVGGQPLQLLNTSIVDTWYTRWGSGSSLTFNTSAGFPEMSVGERYVILLSGGPWQHAPFTHREHSLFHLQPDNTLRCADGSGLYGVMNDGFYCAPAGHVQGTLIKVEEMRDRVLCARTRAASRLVDLETSLSQSPRPLTLTPEPGSEVPR